MNKYSLNPSNQNNLIKNSSEYEKSWNGVISEERLSLLLRPRAQQQSTSIYQASSNLNAPIYLSLLSVHGPINPDASIVNAPIYQASVNIAIL